MILQVFALDLLHGIHIHILHDICMPVQWEYNRKNNIKMTVILINVLLLVYETINIDKNIKLYVKCH